VKKTIINHSLKGKKQQENKVGKSMERKKMWINEVVFVAYVFRAFVSLICENKAVMC
jgi:hypothetical protein